MKSAILPLVLLVFLSGCTTVELAAELVKQSARDKPQPVYKVGDPYKIDGRWYYPERDMEYDETGIASWYGDEFANRPTANGEIFDPDDVSAAHKTLPMPSVVRVTNLDNGRELVVRINDRGPFVAGRIIDMSREGARLLGFREKGTARVRVRIVPDESLRLETAAKDGRFPQLGNKASVTAAEPARKPQNTGAAPAQTSLKATGGDRSATIKPGEANTAATDAPVSSIGLLEDSRKTTVTTGDPVVTDIWIQVGAFSSLETANVMLKKLIAVGRGRISGSGSGDRTLYRVRLGPIQQVADADDMLGKLLALGYEGAHIVLE